MRQGSKEWLEFRRGKIGASEAAIILGVSPWDTPRGLWERKRSGQELTEMPWMKRGKDLEPEARTAYEAMTGLLMIDRVAQHQDLHWMIASLDGMDIDESLIVEIKIPGEADHSLALRGKIPEKYLPQLEQQLLCTGLDRMHYFSYDYRNGKGTILEYKHNEELAEKIIRMETDFWRCLQEGIAPPPTQKELEILTVESERWEHLGEVVEDCNKMLKEAEDRKAKAIAEMKDICDYQSARGLDYEAVKTVSKGSVKYKEIPELKGVDLEKYRGDAVIKWTIRKVS